MNSTDDGWDDFTHAIFESRLTYQDGIKAGRLKERNALSVLMFKRMCYTFATTRSCEHEVCKVLGEIKVEAFKEKIK